MELGCHLGSSHVPDTVVGPSSLGFAWGHLQLFKINRSWPSPAQPHGMASGEVWEVSVVPNISPGFPIAFLSPPIWMRHCFPAENNFLIRAQCMQLVVGMGMFRVGSGCSIPAWVGTISVVLSPGDHGGRA